MSAAATGTAGPEPGAIRQRLSDERGLVGKVIVVTLVLIVVVGLALIEAGSIIFARISLENTAASVAADAARELASSGSTQAAACNAARRSALENDKNARLVQCNANPSTGIVSIRLRKVAPTLIVQHVDFLKKLSVVKATATAGPPAQ